MTNNKFANSVRVSSFDSEDLIVNKDSNVADSQLKYKLRSINLMKHNPNHFRNVGEGFYDLIGGNRTLFTTLGFGVVFMLYRVRANSLRKLSVREGIWMNNIYFWFGSSIGCLYSLAFFSKWQIFLNDYYANHLIKRFPESKLLKNQNIYALKDVPNEDDCYNFSNSFINSYHI